MCFKGSSCPSSPTMIIEFLPPILERFCQFFVQIAHMGLVFPRWGHFAQNTTSKPSSLLSRHKVDTNPSWEYVQTQDTPTPPQNTPFPGMNLKVGKMNYSLAKLDPNWAKCLKSRQFCFRSGQNNFFIPHWATTDICCWSSAAIGNCWSPQNSFWAAVTGLVWATCKRVVIFPLGSFDG